MEDREPPKQKSTGPIHMNYGDESRSESRGGLVSNVAHGSQPPVYREGPQGMPMPEMAASCDGPRYDNGQRREDALGMLDRKIVELESKTRGLVALRKNLGENPSPELEEMVWRILQGEFRRM
jgi:hypothetical protein